MTDHLWPARAEYLRRGTPVVNKEYNGERAAMLVFCHAFTDSEGEHYDVAIEDYDVLTALLDDLSLDLRDPTARAHAAMAYTENGDHTGYPVCIDVLGEWPKHAVVLERMRAMDESVTVDEARAALGWAERAAGTVHSHYTSQCP
jgi:hypothetical protein